MDGEGSTGSCWNLKPTIAAGGPNSDTNLTSKEIDCRDCATSHTRGSIGGPTAIRSCKEAQVLWPWSSRWHQISRSFTIVFYAKNSREPTWRIHHSATPVGHWTRQKWNSRFVGDTTLWQRPICNDMRQIVVSSYTWRGYMAGQTRPRNGQTYHADNKLTHHGYGSRTDPGW